MLDPKAALVSGTFDPVTLGHVDVIERAAAIFDRVVVSVSDNAEKREMFSASDRLEFIRSACAHLINVECAICPGLLVDFIREHGTGTIVRGARGCVDFDYESQLASIMRAFDSRIDVVILPARAEFAHISSTFARELVRFDQPLERAIPKSVIPLLRERINKSKEY